MKPSFDDADLPLTMPKNYCNRTLIVKVIIENVVTFHVSLHSVVFLFD